MGKIIQQHISPTFELSHTKTYELSILVGVDSFSFAVLSDQQRLLALRQYSLEGEVLTSASLEQLVEKEEYLSASYRNSRLAFATTEQVIVPERLYKAADKNAYINSSVRVADGQIISADHLSALGVYLIYPLNRVLEERARALFSGSRLFHLGQALLEGQRRFSAKPDGVYFHLLDNYLFASVLQNGSLSFFNAYRYRSAKDFVYFALLVFEQTGLNPEATSVHLSGQLVEASEIYRLLSRYLPLMEFMDTRAVFTFDVEDDRQVSYQYFDLLSLSLL